MIVKRSGSLYYISPKSDVENKILKPSVPNTELGAKGLEDKKVPRVSLFKSVSLGLMARKGITEGTILTVYQAFPGSRDDLVEPTHLESPFAEYTGEIWSLGIVSLKKVGDIELEKVLKEKLVPVGPKATRFSLKTWKWKDLRPTWEQKKVKLFSSKNYKQVPMSEEIIKSYKGGDNMLRHCRWDRTSQGVAFINNGKLLAYITWSTLDNEIKALEVLRNYRGLGLARDLLKIAIEKGIKKLTVNKNNIPAINLYESIGFRVYKETEAMWFMKL